MTKDYKRKADEVYSMPTSVGALEDRLENIKEVLSDGYFEKYTDESYNPNITANDNLSDSNKNFRLLERMADYIIMSDEGKELNKMDSENRALSTEYLNKKISREQFNDSSANATGASSTGNMFKEEYKNKYPLSKTVINDDDKKNDIIKEYQDIYDNIDNVERFTKRYKDYVKHEIMSDMISVKRSMNQIPTKTNNSSIEAFENVKNTGMYSFDFFDFTDRKTVRAMLSVSEANLNTQYNLYLALLDFKYILNSIDLNDEERFMVDRLQKGFTVAQIVREVNGNYPHFSKTVMNHVIDKIVAVGETYDANDVKSIIFKEK